MRHIAFAVLSCLFAAAVTAAQLQNAVSLQSVQRETGGVMLTVGLENGQTVPVRVSVLNDFLIRVRANSDSRSVLTLPEKDGFLKSDWPGGTFKMVDEAGQLRIEAQGISVRIDKDPLRFSFYQGSRLLTGTVPRQGLSIGPREAALRMTTPAEEHFLGFGDQGSGHDRVFPPERAPLDHRGKTLIMTGLGSNRVYYIPFFMSPRGYGLFVNTLTKSEWDMAQSDSSRYVIEVDEPRLDFYVIAGPSYRDILMRYTEIVGRPPLPPKWMLGGTFDPQLFGRKINGQIMDSGMGVRWFDQKEVESSSTAIRQKGLFADIYLFDSAWQTVRNSFDWVPQIPDPKGMIEHLSRLNLKVVLWQRPTLVKDNYPLFQEAQRRDFLVKGQDGKAYISPKYGGPSGMVDFTNPEAIKWWKEKQADSLRLGARSFKLDSASSAFIEAQPENMELRFHNGATGRDLDNYYGPLYLKTVWDGMRGILGERRAVLGVYHSTYFAAGRFPFMALGDRTRQSPEGPRIRYALNYGLSGVPFWEGAGYGATGLPLVSPELQMRLIPYTYTFWREAHLAGTPIMRAMALAYQDDPESYKADTQFLFGDSFLVAPLVTGSKNWEPAYHPEVKGATPRVGHNYITGQVDWQRVYLPRGEWIDYWSGKKFRGPGWREMRPQTGMPVILVRGGAIIPMGPKIEYVDQKPLDPLILEIYPNGTSSFALYEDDGDTYAYASGAYANTPFHCRETEGGVDFEIGPTSGEYRGKVAERGFVLQIRGTTKPKSVQVGGRPLSEVARVGQKEAAANETFELKPALQKEQPGGQWGGVASGWYYRMKDGYDRTVYIKLPPVPSDRKQTVHIDGASVVRYFLD